MIIAMMIVIRLKMWILERNEFVYKKSQGHVSLASQKMIWMFLRTHTEFSL